MAKFSYPKWACAAIAGGAALTAIEVYGAVSYLVSQAQPNYLVAGGAVVTIAAAGLPILAGRCWRGGRWLLGGLLWLALVPALSVILCAAVERTGGAKDSADRDRQVVAQKIGLAREAVADAKADVRADEAKAVAECSRSQNPKVSPRGPHCTAAEERAEKSRERLKAARGELVQAGVVPKDPMASRLAAVLPVSEADIALYQPLVLPLAISITGLLLIAAGAHQPKRRKVQARRGKRKKRRSPVSPKPSSAKVIPLRRRA
jgi:hypothetical protein